MSSALLLAAGCANPGPPRPPSLDLPQPVHDLSVERIADRLEATWTTPHLTTDRSAVVGAVTAVLCLETRLDGSGLPLTAGKAPRITYQPGASSSCVRLAKAQVQPGTSRVTATLPHNLTTGPARLLALRVELFNSHERTAGASAPAFALAGTAPAPAGVIAATARRGGVLLTWSAVPAVSQEGQMELIRHTLSPVITGARAQKHLTPAGLGSAPAARSDVVRLQAPESAHAGVNDPGGLVDRSVESGMTYSYVAQRVQVDSLSGKTIRILGEPSAAVTITFRDTFAPDAPTDLQAVSSGSLSPDSSAALSIDLSWEPSPQQDVAGYNVYRRVAGSSGFVRLNSQLVAVPAYRDQTVAAGSTYGYRVTAVDAHHNESAPGTVVQQTAEP